MARVLIVDDEDVFRTFLQTYLSRAGYEVQSADSGETGLDLIRRRAPDAIVVDILMSRMDGFEFAVEARKLTSAPVIFVSVTDRKGEALLYGASAYLSKPISGERVRQAIDSAIGGGKHAVVMIVDDAEDIRLLTREMLEPQYRVLEAEHGAAALRALEQLRVDVILLDIHMPVMDGREFLRRLRADARWRDLPVIVQTSDMNLQEEPMWLDMKVEKVMSKDDFCCWIMNSIKQFIESSPAG
ncbi:MAG: hypothetical protein A3G34_13730 [Candidatus Lindowbacteria bacterium RIFCSPLOWO2_12_FULL_62_27]|nr:MAG: hypothetical protein A3I06_12565 [Candidatus Lindowbacteria bacterium RIFCSPLOWO2_02_FULL_62_12]OGH62639.1 MAG: hypothetical protein A3G34_13730 [Candidatus Lindowbacteria bacterium RIFCSPLOWO2_12_FULL_62_27]